MWEFTSHIDIASITSWPFVASNNIVWMKHWVRTETLKTTEGETVTLCLLFSLKKSWGWEWSGLVFFFAPIVNIPFEMMNLNFCPMMFMKCYVVVDKNYLYGSKINWNFNRNTQVTSKSSHFTVLLEWRFGSVDWFWNTPCWNRDQSTLFWLGCVRTVINLSKTA